MININTKYLELINFSILGCLWPIDRPTEANGTAIFAFNMHLPHVAYEISLVFAGKILDFKMYIPIGPDTS